MNFWETFFEKKCIHKKKKKKMHQVGEFVYNITSILYKIYIINIIIYIVKKNNYNKRRDTLKCKTLSPHTGARCTLSMNTKIRKIPDSSYYDIVWNVRGEGALIYGCRDLGGVARKLLPAGNGLRGRRNNNNNIRETVRG